ncbi:hypothetical protein NPIL_106141 [Nephila pilipes]|uniref:Uncharacterized protein n=1 Tax=Nephila pilipes TaxID=299642 RepID=A0A8X6QVP4_NEPPI|nr:hypothetical protein NPIL_106141 [Nephila pilipes]
MTPDLLTPTSPAEILRVVILENLLKNLLRDPLPKLCPTLSPVQPQPRAALYLGLYAKPMCRSTKTDPKRRKRSCSKEEKSSKRRRTMKGKAPTDSSEPAPISIQGPHDPRSQEAYRTIPDLKRPDARSQIQEADT